MIKVTIIQQAPIFLDKEKTIQKAVALIEEAAESGAKLIVFAESELFIP